MFNDLTERTLTACSTAPLAATIAVIVVLLLLSMLTTRHVRIYFFELPSGKQVHEKALTRASINSVDKRDGYQIKIGSVA